MNFLVKEVLYLLDYNDQIQEVLYLSTDRRTPGYAYEINIKDYNTGYSDLSFRMPCDIINEDGEKIKNPKLQFLLPLSKVRYNRTIMYLGEETVVIPEPDGTTKVFPEENGNRMLEDYTMDYVIQPLDKARQGIGINLLYTAIDYPRFSLSKKKVGLTFNQSTITSQELSLYKNAPLSTPGSVQYIPWTEDGEVITWDPNAQAKTYPLDDDAIKKLINETRFSYGILATVFYWPITSSGRFQGVWYEEGGFITLSLYNTYEGSDWEGSDYLNSIVPKWGSLEPLEHYLSPNNACNYLRYILKDTNWDVAGDQKLFIKNTKEQPWFNPGAVPEGEFEEGNYYITYQDLGNDKYTISIYRYEEDGWVDKTNTTFEQIVNTDINDKEFGTLYDIDIEQVKISRSGEASLGNIEYTDARYSLSVDGANCYNAITSEAKLFNLYPVFNCLENKVSLKLNAGKDYGLTYHFRNSIRDTQAKADGEKVITKLYVTGGTDAQGEKNITIGEANRVTSGMAPVNFVPGLESYSASTIKSNMTNMEKSIYDHMNGTGISTGLNMNNKKFKLAFPDNLFELDKNPTTVNLVSFSSGKHISRIYNPTGSDYCYYIYLNDGAESYKDEKKQLYKFDGANITLRRNLEEYYYANLGTINSINTSALATTTYIKYCPELPEAVVKEDNSYIGSIIDIMAGYLEYQLTNIELNQEFVLCGPNRVYTIPTFETRNYGIGNYYYVEDKDTYYYCALEITDSESIYSKINRIIVNGYVFIEIGMPETLLYINVNGTYEHVIKDNTPLKLKDWMVNNYSLRVKYNGSELLAVSTFNPNGEEHIVGRSPYGTSYIYNFKYLYDNGWMDEEDILDIYAINKEINDLNLEFYDRYTQDLINIKAAYNDAVNNYDLYSSKADAQLESLMSQYWVNPNKAGDGQFSAFPGLPADVPTTNFDSNQNKYYMDITYEEPQGDGTTKTLEVKRVYFDIFGSPSCLDNYPYCNVNKITANNPETEGQYHVVAHALGWNNYYTGKLTINSEISGYTEAQDPSKTADSYNKFIKQMKEYYYRAMKAEDQMIETQQALEDLMVEYRAWEEEIAKREKYLQENYGDYIIEGSYSNTEQPYANLLMEDGLEASEQYATPDISYTVGVIDSSGLMEFRYPHQMMCNDVVKRLHNVGQIIPHAGDYVAIQDEPMGMYGVPGLITQIGRRIDDPYQNTITIDTSYSDADELVGNIITATNTVLNNKDIYGRASIINNKGELSSTTVSNALSTGTNSINIVSSNGKVAVDDNGLTCVSPLDKNKAMRYNGIGILGSNNGGATWRELLTQDGINANYINAGTINAGKVAITDGGHDVTVLNGDGLVIKTTPNQPYILGSLKTNTMGIDKAFENVTVFIGKDANGNGVGYFNGYINATKGGNIAGWTIASNALHTSNNSLYLGTSGITAAINGTNRSNLVFKAGANFGVASDGTLYANGATIQGSISASSLTLSSSIKIGENNLVLTNTEALINAQKVRIDAHDTAIAGRVTFSDLSTSGNTTINGANITTGTISASRIDADNLKVKAANVSGTLSAASISGGNVSGGTISSSHIHLNGGTVKLCTGGRVEFSNNEGFFSMGPASGCSNATAVTHPFVSALNVSSGTGRGIQFLSGSYINSPGSSQCSVVYDGANGYLNIGNGSSVGVQIVAKNSKGVNINGGSGSTWINIVGTTITGSGGASMWANEHCAFKPASGKKANVQDTGGSNNAIKTTGGDLSSKNIKTNFRNLAPFEEQILQEFNQIGTYHFDYKYKESSFEKDDDYGFVIDELEEQPLLSKIFLHDEETLQIREDNVLVNLDEPDETLPSITVKRWNSESYIRGLFILTKALHNKIKELEEQLKKEKTN